MPERIQRRRTKGWRTPDGVVYVGRPTRWGNPYEVGHGEARITGYICGPGAGYFRARDERMFETDMPGWEGLPRDIAVALYRNDLLASLADIDTEHDDLRSALEHLRGRDLACWCPLDGPCHADVLLEVANR